MCPHTVDGQVHPAAGWAGGRQSAARWSTRSCGAHVGKRFRRRQRRAGHRSQGGTAPPTQRVPCDPQGACRPVEEWAGVASRLCAVPPLGDRCPGQHQEQSPRHTDRRLSRGVRAFLFLLGILPVPSLHCSEEAHVPGIDAVLREESWLVCQRPHCVEFRSVMGKYKIHRVTSLHQGKQHNPNLLSNAVSHGRWATRGASIAERESVSSSIRVGDWDAAAAARRGTGNCQRPYSVTGHSARQVHARLPAAVR
ncbi:hypothetical protein TCDM_09103 [Trypanosoma cruzi Dm28c]|uniref:Uncharacterized protein n=1 Tax=Trypanosoma cruzi Dm28c TaxID=1416333 RepID=V5B6B9_TRYCR|nr:hypothetical protein TCDM_09103 [Trypanosoma cruzi Dm28c]